jgi:hypothetical protein
MWGVLLVVLALFGAFPSRAGAAKAPKVVVIYGDSLVWESMGQARTHFPAAYQVVDRSVPGTAVCDWLPQLRTDLATLHPAVVVLATAGNTQGSRSCEQNPQNSPQMLADYQSALTGFTSAVAATSAHLVFVEDPPFLDPARNASVVQIDAYEVQLSTQYHHVTVYTAARKAFSTKTGGYEATAKCLRGETAAEGCTSGTIAIRTITGPAAGLHLCPDGNITVNGCDEYSSGEVRFGKDLAAAAMHIPKPILWVYGDSINWESYPKGIKPALSGSYRVRSGAFPGSAPCDNLVFLQNDLINVAKQKPAKYPSYVVFDTVGNSESDCMIDPSTGQHYVPGSDAFYAKYTADIGAFAAAVHQIGAQLLFIAPPPMHNGSYSASEETRLESIEAATGDPVTDLPQHAVGPGDVFTSALPCLPTEHQTQGCVNGSITVRSPDGVHLCPQTLEFPDPCPVYSSGEKRWGTAVGAAVDAAF